MFSFSKILSFFGFILIVGSKGYSQTPAGQNLNNFSSVKNQESTNHIKFENNHKNRKVIPSDESSVDLEITQSLVKPVTMDSTMNNTLIPEVQVNDNFFGKSNDLKEIKQKE